MAPSPSAPGMVHIAATTTDLDVAKRVASLFGTAVTTRGKERQHHKTAWQVRLRGSLAAELMNALRPLMGKRRQAQIDRALSGPLAKSRRRMPACGTLTAYRNGCRCEPCKSAKRAEYQARKGR